MSEVKQALTNLNIQDLATMVTIIDACTKRGAFEGSELLVVGQLREKVDAVVKANTPKKEEVKTSQEPTE